MFVLLGVAPSDAGQRETKVGAKHLFSPALAVFAHPVLQLSVTPNSPSSNHRVPSEMVGIYSFYLGRLGEIEMSMLHI